MHQVLRVLVLAGLTAAAAPAADSVLPKPGTYEIAVFASRTGWDSYGLVKIAPQRDGVEGSMIASHPQIRGISLKSVSVEGDTIRVVITAPPLGGDRTFEFRVPKAGADTMLGAIGIGPGLSPARLSITDKAELTMKNFRVPPELPEPMRRLEALSTKLAELRRRAGNGEGVLAKDVASAEQEYHAEMPKLLREVAEKYADNPATIVAVQGMLRRARREDADVRQVRGWATCALGIARNFGEPYEAEVATQIAELLAPQSAYAPVALECAQRAAKGLSDDSTFRRKVQVLNSLATAQKKAGQPAVAATTEARLARLELDNAMQAEKALKDDDDDNGRLHVLATLAAAQRKSGLTAEAAATTARVTKIQSEQTRVELERAIQAGKDLTDGDTPDKKASVLDALVAAQRKSGLTLEADRTVARLEPIQVELDRKYHDTMPPFKPTAFAGRKSPNGRVAVMELFTGAQCPPCVGADLAFDGLGKTYKPEDVVLIQYHLHIPGPDPMTNPATESRWAYYRERYPDLVVGVPTAVFGGIPEPSAGGSATKSEELYKNFRGILDALLEQAPKAAVSLHASRRGDTVIFQAEVSKLTRPGEAKRLRLLLVEESIRFLGSNKIRFHHMVVRAMPGGPDGLALTTAESKHTVSLNLTELREELTNYLGVCAVMRRPFPQPGRPLAFNSIKMIALVQDDKTGEILNAAQWDMKDAR